MGKHRETCVACNERFPLTELHIDPATSEWYCDPCYNVMMIDRIDPEGGEEEDFEDEERS